jgi:hypothetical protein
MLDILLPIPDAECSALYSIGIKARCVCKRSPPPGPGVPAQPVLRHRLGRCAARTYAAVSLSASGPRSVDCDPLVGRQDRHFASESLAAAGCRARPDPNPPAGERRCKPWL